VNIAAGSYLEMFKKKTVLNVRPEPPSFAEIMEDINSAESNDIIFAQHNNGMMVYIVEHVLVA